VCVCMFVYVCVCVCVCVCVVPFYTFRRRTVGHDRSALRAGRRDDSTAGLLRAACGVCLPVMC
jgi:hypothetical protein